ncbi:MAG TPA: hypothetical protein EYP40_03625 [Chromatiales bacterium]|nr:hypothetical protein [Chromatiales bacterium]
MIPPPIQTALFSPLGRRLSWVLFAILFYLSGEATTVWLLEPAGFPGGWHWLGVALFPVLLPAFFVLQRFFGCRSARCQSGACAGTGKQDNSLYPRPPG